MLKLDDLDKATRLRNYRRNAEQMLRTVQCGLFDVCLGTEEISLSTQINIMPVRDFVTQELIKHIQHLEALLRTLGVEVEETTL